MEHDLDDDDSVTLDKEDIDVDDNSVDLQNLEYKLEMRRAFHQHKKNNRNKKGKKNRKNFKNRKTNFNNKNLLPKNVFNSLKREDKDKFKAALTKNDIQQIQSLKDKFLSTWKRKNPNGDSGRIINLQKSTKYNCSQWMSLENDSDFDDISRDDNASVDSTDIEDTISQRRWNLFGQWFPDAPDNGEGYTKTAPLKTK